MAKRDPERERDAGAMPHGADGDAATGATADRDGGADAIMNGELRSRGEERQDLSAFFSSTVDCASRRGRRLRCRVLVTPLASEKRKGVTMLVEEDAAE